MTAKVKKQQDAIDAEKYYTQEQVKTFLWYTHREGVKYLIKTWKIPAKFVEVIATTPFYKKYRIKGEAVLQLLELKK